jgi:putative membrane protein
MGSIGPRPAIETIGSKQLLWHRVALNWSAWTALMNQQTTGASNTELAHDRTGLAKFRTQLALDRTTLAWIRTTLTMATFGFGTVGFFRTLRERSPNPHAAQMHQGAIKFGFALVFLGILATVLAGVSHWRTLRRLRRNDVPVLTQWPLSVTVAMLLAVIGLVSVWVLLAR